MVGIRRAANGRFEGEPIMANIWVSPHPSLRAENRVALYERHPAHPDGEIAIDGADAGPHEVAETPGVLDALAQPGPGLMPRLVRVDPPSRTEREALETPSGEMTAAERRAAERARTDAGKQAASGGEKP
jgi:hypothetical protein